MVNGCCCFIGNPSGFIYDWYHAVFIDYTQKIIYHYIFIIIIIILSLHYVYHYYLSKSLYLKSALINHFLENSCL